MVEFYHNHKIINADDFSALKDQFSQLNESEGLIKSLNFEIGILNVIRSCVLVKSHVFFITVKVFDSLDKLFDVYGYNKQAAIVIQRFEAGFRIFVIELHISKSIEELLLTRKWLINISVRDSKQIGTKIVELSKRPFRYFIIMKSDDSFVNKIDVKLIVRDRTVEIPYQIYLKIDQVGTNILNLFHLNNTNMIDEKDKNNLLKFTFENVFDINKIYKGILNHFYYNLDVSDFDKFNEDSNKWPMILFGSVNSTSEPIIIEFKIRNKLLKLYANPRNMLDVKTALLDERNIGIHDDADCCIPVNVLKTKV